MDIQREKCMEEVYKLMLLHSFTMVEAMRYWLRKNNYSVSQTATIFGVSETTIKQWYKQFDKKLIEKPHYYTNLDLLK